MSVRTRPKIAFVVTTPVTAKVLLRGQLGYLVERGFDVAVISAPGPELDAVASREGVRTIPVEMAREIDPPTDSTALWRLVQVLRELRPDIVNASTAKAGLLGMLAARAVGTPIRVYLLRGLRLETERGVKRQVLGVMERIAARCAHQVVCVSETLRARYVADGFAPASKCVVLGDGSSNGVDIARFARTPERESVAAELAHGLGIPPSAPVVGFVGRPVGDKGIVELIAAFDAIKAAHPEAHLLLVGAGFASDRLAPDAARRLGARPDVRIVGHVEEPAPYYVMMDVLAFPSYREGFPNVPLEAAAAGVPTVGFRATGVTDAVIDGETGLLVDVGDTEGLARALATYLGDPDLRARHGARAAVRVRTAFDREVVWSHWASAYEALLRARGPG